MARRFQFWITGLVQLVALAAWAQAGHQSSLDIYVYNKAGVSSGILSHAEQDATRIFRISGLHAMWVECSTAEITRTDCNGLPQPGDVVLQIVHETRELKDDVFGAAFLGRDGTGQYTNVFYDRVNELHRDWNVSLADMLGHVMAHEVGHLLLGLNAHSISGIMRSHWDSAELKAAERGRLLFSAEQSRIMRERLATATSRRDTRNALAFEFGSPGN